MNPFAEACESQVSHTLGVFETLPVVNLNFPEIPARSCRGRLENPHTAESLNSVKKKEFGTKRLPVSQVLSRADLPFLAKKMAGNRLLKVLIPTQKELRAIAVARGGGLFPKALPGVHDKNNQKAKLSAKTLFSEVLKYRLCKITETKYPMRMETREIPEAVMKCYQSLQKDVATQIENMQW